MAIKTLKIKEYQPTDIALFVNTDGTYGISAILTALSDVNDERGKPLHLFQKRVRIDLDASDTAKIESLLTKLLTKAEVEGMI